MLNKHQCIVPKGSNPRTLQTARFLSILHEQTGSRKEYRQGEWIPIHSDRLQAEVGRHYCAAITETVHMGIAERNGSWSTGRRAGGYRLTEKFRDGDHEVCEQRRGKTPESCFRVPPTDTTALKLVEMFPKVMIPTDVQAEGWNGSALARIRRGQFFATRGEHGRLFTTFASLGKDIRKELRTVDGERLIEVDVSCCQPLLLWHLSYRGSGHHCPDTFCPQYRTLCEAGQLYDYLLELCQTERQQHPVPDRPEVNWPSDKGELKEAFLSKLFGTIRTMQRSPVYNVFARAFPEIARYLIASKTNNYRQTSWDCQKLESRLMIDGACTSVLTNYPEVVLLTVHDAVLVQQKLVGAVESAIQDQFRSVGVTPTLKIDGVPSRLLAGRRRKEQTITHTPSIPMSCTSNV